MNICNESEDVIKAVVVHLCEVLSPPSWAVHLSDQDERPAGVEDVQQTDESAVL